MAGRIITIVGAPGSGKSSTAKRVAQELGFTHFSAGDLLRHIASDRGLTIEELNKTAELEEDIDHMVDQKLRDLKDADKLVIDSRLGFYWIPDSFKVYLSLPLETAAQRIFSSKHTQERSAESAPTIEDMQASIFTRMESEKKRYENLYGIDISDLSMFDLVIDTGTHNLEQVVQMILKEYAKKKENRLDTSVEPAAN